MIIANRQPDGTETYERKPAEFLERIFDEVDPHVTAKVVTQFRLGFVGFDIIFNQTVWCDRRYAWLIRFYDRWRRKALRSLRAHFRDLGVMREGERWAWLPRWLAEWPIT